MKTLSYLNQFKMKLVKLLYKKESIMFKMFFDKFYRPERYQAIVTEFDNFDSVHDFNAYLLRKHYKYPLKATEGLSLIPKR